VSSVSQSSVSYTYNPATLALDTETISYNLDGAAGYEFTRVLDRSQDTLLRDSGWELKNGTTIENKAGYQYSATTGRLEKVLGLASPSLASSEFTYTYEPNSNLVKTITGPAHTVTNTYESNRDILDTKWCGVRCFIATSSHNSRIGVSPFGLIILVIRLNTPFPASPPSPASSTAPKTPSSATAATLWGAHPPRV